MNIYSICALCVICAIASLVVKKYNPEISLLIGIAGSVIVCSVLLSNALSIATEVKNLIAMADMPNEYVVLLFKALGICFICEFACDTCDDAGEKALSSKIRLAGKISVAVMTLPLIKTVTQTVLTLISE